MQPYLRSLSVDVDEQGAEPAVEGFEHGPDHFAFRLAAGVLEKFGIGHHGREQLVDYFTGQRTDGGDFVTHGRPPGRGTGRTAMRE